MIVLWYWKEQNKQKIRFHHTFILFSHTNPYFLLLKRTEKAKQNNSFIHHIFFSCVLYESVFPSFPSSVFLFLDLHNIVRGGGGRRRRRRRITVGIVLIGIKILIVVTDVTHGNSPCGVKWVHCDGDLNLEFVVVVVVAIRSWGLVPW